MTEAKKTPKGESVAETAETPAEPARNGAPSPRDMADYQADAGDIQAAAEGPTPAEIERQELRDKLLRTLAEMENLRRRTEREIADARTYATTAFARDMLTVADNIARALQSVAAETPAAEGPLKTLVEGVSLTERDLVKTLERHGVRRLEPDGQRFDPNLHQAMFEIPNPDVPKGTIVAVVQSGYAIGDRILRPALVGVSTGGPKAAPAPAAADESADGSGI
jgi:molecular chaperone GrpE